MGLKRASEEQVVPGSNKKTKPTFTFDPELPIVTATIDVINANSDAFGKLEVLQPIDCNGQGYFLLTQPPPEFRGGYNGPVIIKYLGYQNEVTRQARELAMAGVGVTDPSVVASIGHASMKRNTHREIEFAGRLSHDNIVKILAFVSTSGQSQDITAIIMEGASNGVLETFAKKQLAVPQIKRLALQVAKALEYCYEQGIMHRDLNLRNLYIFDDGKTIKLGNFAYANTNDGSMKTANKGEDIRFRAPEMILAGALTNYTCSVDVYGLALVIWSMCHEGRKPFENEPSVSNPVRFRGYLEASPENRPPIRPDLDPKLSELIRKCWITETDLERRPTMSDVVRALEAMQLSL